MSESNSQNKRRILLCKLAIYLCAGLLTVAGMLCRASLDRFDCRKEVIALLVPLVVALPTFFCLRKMHVGSFMQRYPLLWVLPMTALGFLLTHLSDQLRNAGASSLPWGALAFCMAGALLLYALQKYGIFGLLGFFLYQIGVSVVVWRHYETAGVVLILAATFILLVCAARRRWFLHKLEYWVWFFLAMAVTGVWFTLIASYDVTSTLYRLYETKLGPLWVLPRYSANTSVRTALPFSVPFGTAAVVGTDGEWITQFLSFPRDDYMLSSVLFRYGWVCAGVLSLLMLAIPILCVYLTSFTARGGANLTLSKAANACLFASFSIYLLQAFGFCVVQALYVPFFDRSPASGTLSLLLLILSVRGVGQSPAKAQLHSQKHPSKNPRWDRLLEKIEAELRCDGTAAPRSALSGALSSEDRKRSPSDETV